VASSIRAFGHARGISAFRSGSSSAVQFPDRRRVWPRRGGRRTIAICAPALAVAFQASTLRLEIRRTLRGLISARKTLPRPESRGGPLATYRWPESPLLKICPRSNSNNKNNTHVDESSMSLFGGRVGANCARTHPCIVCSSADRPASGHARSVAPAPASAPSIQGSRQGETRCQATNPYKDPAFYDLLEEQMVGIPLDLAAW
jgi:hypothetical protein